MGCERARASDLPSLPQLNEEPDMAKVVPCKKCGKEVGPVCRVCGNCTNHCPGHSKK
jgi:hypothetical protein